MSSKNRALPKHKKAYNKNRVIISDTHCGCQFGLCPPKIQLDGGGIYVASPLQNAIWENWQSFWGEWVPQVTHNEPFSVIINGDTQDGVHHHSTTQISHNLSDQQKIAEACLKPIADMCDGQLYIIRGTEAHVGQSAENEERLAKSLGAIQDDNGNFSRFELWIRVGDALCHIMHHIGCTGSAAYEATAVNKELTESFVEAGRWNDQPPQFIVRSHRHRCIEVRIPAANKNGESCYSTAFTTAGWQGKTPFTYKIPGARISQPQIGGSLIRAGDEEVHSRHRYVRIARPGIVD
jgi:hypothetical protein